MPNLKIILLYWLLFSVPISVNAEFTCQNKKSAWSNSKPAINLKHIFCGESHNGRNKGFHSSYLLSDSAIVLGIFNKKPLNGGIYNARVKFQNGKTKFSTFFPDHCNITTITRSVVYAATHISSKHPQWGILGLSAPETNNAGYCLQYNGMAFMIRMGLINQGTQVNTAFPQP